MIERPSLFSAESRERYTARGALRPAVLAIFLFTTFGAAGELLLIDHTEDYWQLIPIVLLGLSVIVLIAHAFVRRAATVRAFQLTMLLFIAGGVAGVLLHYWSKAEFKKEMNPDLAGMQLFWESIKGSSVPPVIAPGIMIQLALLGLAWTWRHPALAGPISIPPSTQTGESE